MSSEAKVSYDLKRFAGIRRDYTPEEVERLRGSIKIEYSICKQQSKKFLLGQVMKATKGQADPSVSMSLINEILDKKK